VKLTRGAGLAALLALAGCAGTARAPVPIELAYPEPPAHGFASSAELRSVAERVAPSYVRVSILAPLEDHPVHSTAVLNGASGVIVDPRGYVVTAAHIAVRAGLGAEVITADGVRRQGRVVHVARERELALLSIDPFDGLREACIGDSTALRPGQPVFAIGAPDNRAGVVTPGTVSKPALEARIAYGDFSHDNPIELDMAIEPGHSGGPLFAADGCLVGIVASFVLGDTRRVPYVSTRIAYAVPSVELAAYLHELLEPLHAAGL